METLWRWRCGNARPLARSTPRRWRAGLLALALLLVLMASAPVARAQDYCPFGCEVCRSTRFIVWCVFPPPGDWGRCNCSVQLYGCYLGGEWCMLIEVVG